VERIAYEMPDTRDPDEQRKPELERVELSYESIAWHWIEGNIQAIDRVGGMVIE
jgi:hypothetical protein